MHMAVAGTQRSVPSTPCLLLWVRFKGFIMACNLCESMHKDWLVNLALEQAEKAVDCKANVANRIEVHRFVNLEI